MNTNPRGNETHHCRDPITKVDLEKDSGPVVLDSQTTRGEPTQTQVIGQGV